MVGIGEAVVTEVVTDRGDEDREGVQLAQLSPLLHTTFRQEDVAHL